MKGESGMQTTNVARCIKAAFLSTYPPRECGLATFTQDLVNALDKMNFAVKTSVIAINNNLSYKYDDKIIMEIEQNEEQDYLRAADYINNNSDIDILVLEHEYGIFGGPCGKYVITLLDKIKKPVVSTLHTVLPTPLEEQKQILQAIGQKSTKVVTMAGNTCEVLEHIYNIERSKIAVIHHGVPCIKVNSREELKKQFNLEDKFVISTFGLISPGKGLEYGIKAVSKVAQKHKNVIYLILGQTHPCIVKEQGEKYRQKLERLVDELGAKENIKFVNKYLDKEEIIQYLQMSDAYMTPYLGKDQAVSGTLAYAVGYGRVVVSTPYSYAKEMLADGRGMLAEFNDENSLADCLNFIIENPDRRYEMEQKTQQLGNTMMWDNVASKYYELFKTIL